MAKYTSGDQLNLKIGVESHSESLTSLEVVGRVGIGTTSATVPLDVVGDVNVSGAITATSFAGDGSALTNITGASVGPNDSINTTGIITASQFHGDGSNLTNLPGASIGPNDSINTTGIITASQFHGDGSNLTGLTAGDVGALAGVSIREEGSVVGTAGSVGNINFVSGNLTATASGIAATITLTDDPTFSTVNATGVITASSFSGNATSATSATTATTATQVTVADESSDSTCNVLFTTSPTGNLAPKSGTNLTFNSSNGTLTATAFSGDGSNITGLTAGDVGALAGVSIREEGSVVGTAGSVGDINFVSTNLTATASGAGATITLSDTPTFTSTVVGSAVTINGSGINATGVITATSFSGDGSNLTSLPASASSGEFFTGITSSVQITPSSFETPVFTFPSTSGKQYVIESINVANIDTSVGVGTTVNIIASIQDATAAEQTYIAYNVPIVNGGLLELLKNPIVAGPSDVIRMWVTSDNYAGVSNAVEVYINYDEYTSTNYVNAFASTVSIATTDVTDIFTSTSNPTVIESIHLANRTDTGDYPVSVRITQGTSTSHLVKDLIIPRYAAVDILDRPKRIETDSVISVKVESTSTIDVIVSGKKITS